MDYTAYWDTLPTSYKSALDMQFTQSRFLAMRRRYVTRIVFMWRNDVMMSRLWNVDLMTFLQAIQLVINLIAIPTIIGQLYELLTSQFVFAFQNTFNKHKQLFSI